MDKFLVFCMVAILVAWIMMHAKLAEQGKHLECVEREATTHIVTTRFLWRYDTHPEEKTKCLRYDVVDNEKGEE